MSDFNFKDDELDFTGSEGAEAAATAAAEAAAGGSFNRVEFFRLDGSPGAVQTQKNSTLLRFLSDVSTITDPDGTELPAMISVHSHASVQTKAKPANHEGNWPKSMSATCRKDKIFTRKYNGTCYICEAGLINTNNGKPSRPTDRKWALAVLREEVIGDGSEALLGEAMRGKVVGVRDKMKEIVKTDADGKASGETEWVKAYVKVNLGWQNFFQPLSGMGARYGTLLDRDYYIARTGEGTDTAYSIIPNDPIPWSKDTSRTFDLRDPEIRAAEYPDLPNLRAIVAATASDDLFNRFFIPEADQQGGAAPATKAPATPAQEQVAAKAPEAPTSDQATPGADRMAAIKERVMGKGAGEAAEPAQCGATGALSF